MGGKLLNTEICFTFQRKSDAVFSDLQEDEKVKTRSSGQPLSSVANGNRWMTANDHS